MSSSLCRLRYVKEAFSHVRQPRLDCQNTRRKNVLHRCRVRHNSTDAVDRKLQTQTVYVDEEGEDGRRQPSYTNGQEPAVYPRKRPTVDPEPLVRHLKRLFPPLDFPPTVAKRMLTHISAVEAWEGHNARLSFVGRRVLHSYLHLYLHSIPQHHVKDMDYDLIAYRALFTNLLGEYVGRKWELSRVMVWTPAVPDARRKNLRSAAEIGLYKVQGTTVEGIIGGIFHQFGGSIAHRVFHTRVLPHILLPGTPQGLPDYLHEPALKVMKQMGGINGSLIDKRKLQSAETNIPAPRIADSVIAGV